MNIHYSIAFSTNLYAGNNDIKFIPLFSYWKNLLNKMNYESYKIMVNISTAVEAVQF